jgi:hypothetical protein
MNIFNATINPGIGDILLCRNMLDAIKHQYDAIVVSPNPTITQNFREVSERKYYNFCLSFMKEVFSIPPYKVVENGSFQRFSPIDGDFRGLVLTKDAVFKMNDYSSLLCNEKAEQKLREPYIVITTKVRGTPTYNRYTHKYKEKIMKIIRNLSNKYAIVLIGEKTPPNNPENRMIGPDRVFCMYEDIKKEIGFVDMTLDRIQTEIPDINRIKNDCMLMNKANAVITLGIGGNMILSSMVSKKSINFLEDVHYCRYYEGVVNQPQREGITITNNFHLFTEKCNEL